MPDVVKHAHTHRPKALGGTDPVPINLPWCRATLESSQTVTEDSELLFESSITNDPDVFRWDPDDPAGMLILQKGIYGCFSTVRYATGSIAVERSMYQTAQMLSGGPLFGLGSELGEDEFSVGQGQGEAGLGEVTTIAKNSLTHMAVARILPAADDPMRLAVILIHLGTNYTISGLDSATYVVKLASATVMATPPPDEPAP